MTTRIGNGFGRWTHGLFRLGVLSLALFVSGCASLLGIEEATCDPAVDDACDLSNLLDGGGGSDSDAGFDAGVDASFSDVDASDGGESDDGESEDASEPEPSPDAQGSDTAAEDTDAEQPDGGEPDSGIVDASVEDARVQEVQDSGVEDAAAKGQDAQVDAAAIERQVCTTYCEELSAACDEVVPQYATVEACETICIDGLDVGSPDDTGVDTVYCRLNALRSGLAFGETEAVCEGAGMSGIGECGPVCEIYCSLVEYRCPDQFNDPGVFNGDYDTCLAGCSEVPIPSDLRFGSGVPSANTLQCRMFHIQNAFGNATTHCPHTVGDGVCVDPG